MQISGSRSFTPLRQPTRSRTDTQGGQNLVFLYPMLFDTSLQKYTDLLRDFMVVDFIGQIKISNVNTVISDAVKFGSTGKNKKEINPTEQVLKSLNHVYGASTQPESDSHDYYSPYTADEYQRHVQQFLGFVRNQLKHDPRYNDLRPLISSIVVEENLMQIPLIVGTKSKTAKAKSLYWILLLSILYGDLPLDKKSSMDKIQNILKSMSPEKFMFMLFSDDQRKDLTSELGGGGYSPHQLAPTSLSKISKYINDETLQVCFGLHAYLNRDKWDLETNHLSTSANSTQESIPVIQNRTQKRHFDNAMSNFSSYVSSIIMPILHSMEAVMGPTPQEIDFDSKISDFTENTVRSMDEYYRTMIMHVTNDLVDYTQGAQDRVDNALYKLEELRNMCEASALQTAEIQKRLSSLDRNIRLPIRFSTDNVLQLLTSLSDTAGSVGPHSAKIENFLTSFVKHDTQLEHMFNVVKGRFKQAVDLFFYGNEPYSLYDPSIESYNDEASMDYFTRRYSNFYSYVCGKSDPDDAGDCAKYFVRVIDKVSHCVSELLWFFFIWNFFSYMGEYMNDVEIDIEIQRRDVLDFPNYCMVLPLDIFKYLYTVYSAKNMHSLLKSDDPQKNSALEKLKFDDVTPNLQNVAKMIQIVNSRLKVPNLIVLDEYKKMVYYQFMYMGQPNKVSLQSLQNYVKHQKDVLPGF